MHLCKFINILLESVKFLCLLSIIGQFWYLYKFSSFFKGLYCILILEIFQGEMEVELAGSTVDHREISFVRAVEIVTCTQKSQEFQISAFCNPQNEFSM